MSKKIKSKSKSKKNIFDTDISFGFGRIDIGTRAVFAKNLAVMLKSGLPLLESLNILVDSTNGRFKKIIQGVMKSVESGHSLSSALSIYPKVFFGAFISSVYAGEKSGTLEENLRHTAERLKKEKELIAKVKGAMFYPVVVLIASFILGLIMALVVLPKITPLFEGLKIELPMSTRILIGVSHFVQNNYLVLIFGIIISIIFIFWLLRQKFIKPITHWILLHIPIIKSVSRNTNLVRFCLTLGTLLESGLSIDEAIKISQKSVGNYYYQQALMQVSQHIGKGSKLSNNLAAFSDLFPVMVIRMIKVGEESGRLEEILLYLAEYYEVEVDTTTKTLATAVEPILLIGIGFVVAFLALSIITPIYKITGGVRR